MLGISQRTGSPWGGTVSAPQPHHHALRQLQPSNFCQQSGSYKYGGVRGTALCVRVQGMRAPLVAAAGQTACGGLSAAHNPASLRAVHPTLGLAATRWLARIPTAAPLSAPHHACYQQQQQRSVAAAARSQAGGDAQAGGKNSGQQASQQDSNRKVSQHAALVDSEELSAELDAAVTTAVAAPQPSPHVSQQVRELAAARRVQYTADSSPTLPSPPPSDTAHRPEWLSTHATVWQLIGSGGLTACLLIGAFFWARYAVTQVARKTGEGADGPISSGTGASSQSPEDRLDDPWAPIRFILGAGGSSSGGNSSGDSSGDSSGGQGGVGVGSGSIAGTGPSSIPGTSVKKAGSSTPEVPAAPTVPRLPAGWWRGLDRVYYANFGAKLGILPRMGSADEGLLAAVTGGSRTAVTGSGSALLLVFEDKVEAEFVASALHADLCRAHDAAATSEALAAAVRSVAGAVAATGGSSVGGGGSSTTSVAAGRRAGSVSAASAPPRPQIVSAAPTYLEDVARAQSSELAVVPRDVLTAYFSTQLNQDSMISLLSDILRGRTPVLLPTPPTKPARPATSPPASPVNTATASLPARGIPLNSTSAPANAALMELEQLAGVRLPTAFDFPGFEAPPAQREAAADAAAATAAAAGSASGTAGSSSRSRTGQNMGPEEGSNAPSQKASQQASVTAAQQPTQAAPTVSDSRVSQAVSPPASQPEPEPELVTASLVIEPPPVAPSARWEAATLSQPAAPSQQWEGVSQPRTTPVTEQDRGVGSTGAGTAAHQPVTQQEDDVLSEYEAFKRAYTGGALAFKDDQAEEEEEEQRGPTAVDANAVAAVLRRSGPTDAALEEAATLLGVPAGLGADPSLAEDLLKEWHALQQGQNAEEEEGPQDAAPQQAAPSQPAGSGARAAVAAAAAAAASMRGSTGAAAGSSGRSVSQVDTLRSQLELLESQIAKLAGGSSGSSDLQQRATRLRSMLDAVTPNSSSNSSSGSSGSSNSSSVSAASVTSSKPTSTPKSSTASSSALSEAVGKRSWGAWTTNPRIQDAGVSLLKPVTSANTSSSQARGVGAANAHTTTSQQQPSQPTVPPPAGNSSPAAAARSTAPDRATGSGGSSGSEAGESAGRMDDGAVIVSKRAGKERPWKKERDAAERQATVKEAMRFVSSGLGGGVEPDTERVGGEEVVVDRTTGIDWSTASRKSSSQAKQKVERDGSSSSSKGGKEKWWSRRFEVLYLPTIRYSDGSVGFVQIDVSLQPERRDVRVVTFEDRHDAMHCLTIMKQWPEYEWHVLEMCALPASKVEGEVVRAWEAAQDEAGRTPTRPTGVVVFRRGKLPMRVGMSPEQFTQLVVYQAAAQVSLSRVGYDFDDF